MALHHRRKLGKRHVALRCDERCAGAAPPPDIDYLFAPLKARAPRLSGAEGDRTGRAAPPAGHHPSHGRRAGQSRTHARQRHRGRRTVQSGLVPEVLSRENCRMLLASWEAGRRACLLRRSERRSAIRSRRCGRCSRPARRAGRAGGRLHAGRARPAARAAVRDADFARSPDHARRYRRRCRAGPRARRVGRLEMTCPAA